MNLKNWPAACYILLCSLAIMACSFAYDTYQPNDDEPNMVMENAEYVRIKNGSPEIRVQAEEIRQYEAKHTMELDIFTFEQYNPAPVGQAEIPGINARGKAGLAQMETDTNNFYMRGGVSLEVVSEDFSLETEEVSWQNEEKTLKAPGSVSLNRSNGTTIQGKGFLADVRGRSWEFESAVEGSIIEDDDDNN